MILLQAEISTMLESLRKKLRLLNKTKEQWEETKHYIKVKIGKLTVSSLHDMSCVVPVRHPNAESHRCDLFTHFRATHTRLLFTGKSNQLPQHYRLRLTKARVKSRRSSRSYTCSFGRRKSPGWRCSNRKRKSRTRWCARSWKPSRTRSKPFPPRSVILSLPSDKGT